MNAIMPFKDPKHNNYSITTKVILIFIVPTFRSHEWISLSVLHSFISVLFLQEQKQVRIFVVKVFLF